MKKVLFSFLLTLIVISCRNNIISPVNLPKDNKEEQYAKVLQDKEVNIDEKYPYWKVGVSKFWVNGKGEYAELTIAEKKFFLESLALMRLTINTDEFVEAYIQNQEKFLADKTVNIGQKGAIYGSVEGQKFDINRLIKVIRATEYDVEYGKGAHKTAHVYGNLGSYLYSYYGSSEKLRIGKRIWVHNNNIIGYYGLAFFSALMYHEHLHNIGFTHDNNGNFYEMQSTMRDVANRIVSGDLKEKYRKDLEEITTYYLNKYKHLLESSTVYDPNKQ